MIYITPLLLRLDPMISSGEIVDTAIISKVDQAWGMIEHPDTSSSTAFWMLHEEIKAMVGISA